MKIKLEKGKTYFNCYNRKKFKVVGINGDTILFQYAGSDVCEGDLKQKMDLIEKTLIDKMDGYEQNLSAYKAVQRDKREKRQEKFLEKIEIDKISESRLYFTLGFLSKNCFLELRTVPDTDVRDRSRYFDATGKNPSEESEGYEFDDHPKTWATKIYLRFKDIDVNAAKYLYFPDNIEGRSLILREDGFYYYNVEWCWVLIEKYGFRLARNHDIELLRYAVPLKYLSDFEAGLNQ
jgi:hypothetical protein